MSTRDVTLVVIAKAPVAGRSKTRLTPPCTPEQAAALARAALQDTLDVVLATPAARRVCVLDGEPGPWLPSGIEVVPQRGDGLDDRLANAFDDVGGAILLVGMDTPQLTPALLGASIDVLHGDGVDAVLGRAPDGGWWALGLHRPDARLLRGVPMSAGDTGVLQRRRLIGHGLRVVDLPWLRDVDHFADAVAAANAAPGGRFARVLREVAA